MTSSASELAVVTACAVLLTLAISAPVLRAPSERVFGKELIGRHHDPFTVMAQFDQPLTLNVYSQPATDIPGALLSRIAGPVAAYNWLVLLSFPLSAAAAYVLARHLRLSSAGAGFAAMAFAFSPFHIAHAAYHLQIAQTQWVALYFFALWRCLEDTSRRAIGLLVVATAGVTLSNFYGGLIAAVVTPVAVSAYWFFKTRGRPHALVRFSVTLATLILLAGGMAAYAWFLAHTGPVDAAPMGFARRELFLFSAKWWSYLLPPVAHPLLGGLAGHAWADAGVGAGLLEQQVSLGWGIVGLGLVACVGWAKRDRECLSQRSTKKTLDLFSVPILAIVALAALLCSLSPERTIGAFTWTRPSALLYRVAPMFRAYARFGVVVQLMAALLAAIGAERLWRAGRRGARLACASLLALVACEYAVWPPDLSRDVLPTTAERWVTRLPGRVRALDCAPLTLESESVPWLSGYRISMSDGWLDDCAEPNLADKLSAADYTHVIARPTQPTPQGLRRVASVGDLDVFAVVASRPLVYTAGMQGFYGREHDESGTWRWMGPDASWKVVNAGNGPTAATLEIELTAFHTARGVRMLLDGRDVQVLSVPPRRSTILIGPLALTPGVHQLLFHPVELPTVADHAIANGDQRPLSLAVGTWRWIARRAQS